jgi:hypothetical protein
MYAAPGSTHQKMELDEGKFTEKQADRQGDYTWYNHLESVCQFKITKVRL